MLQLSNFYPIFSNVAISRRRKEAEGLVKKETWIPSLSLIIVTDRRLWSFDNLE